MQTVNVLRKGKVQIEWVDSSILKKTADEDNKDEKEEEASAAAGEEKKDEAGKTDDAAGEEKDAAGEEKLFCTQPPLGMRAKWQPQQVQLHSDARSS
jgi:hypothetical protein